jgi:outer membrane murein-binding lipoprotein Lpp
MNAWPIALLSLAAVALVLLAGASGGLWLAQRRANARLDALHEAVTRLLQAQAPLEARLEALASLVREERECATLPAAVPGRAYELAAHLASSGAGMDQLVAQCGLTPAEAELAVRIHGLRARTRAA